MGKKLNALLGRSSKTAKLRMLANLAISRIAILRNLHSVRCSQAQSDVIQLLLQGHQERALLRVSFEKDVADAAQDAFESAAYAAAAARAAVELSRLESWDEDPDYHVDSHHQHLRYNSSPISETQTGRDVASDEVNSLTLGFNLATIHPVDSASSGSDCEDITENRNRCHLKKNAKAVPEEKSLDPYYQNGLRAEVHESDDEIRKNNNRRAHLRYYQNRSDLHRNALPQYQTQWRR